VDPHLLQLRKHKFCHLLITQTITSIMKTANGK